MNKEELKKIINNFYSFEDPLKSKLNIKDKKYDLVIVSPTWKPHFVFNDDYKVEDLKLGTVASYKLNYKNKKLLFLRTGKGAPSLYDNLLLLNDIESRFIFLGSAGSLNKDIKVGDIVIPNKSISGDGASIYFEEKLDGSNMFKTIEFNKKLIIKLNDIANKIDVISKSGNVYSIDTLIGEYYHLKEIIKSNAICIEQETAAFGNSMNIMEKEGVPILVISDSLIDGVNYYEPLENKKDYLETRTKKLQKIITNIL